jgi:hypothetical protein
MQLNCWQKISDLKMKKYSSALDGILYLKNYLD